MKSVIIFVISLLIAVFGRNVSMAHAGTGDKNAQITAEVQTSQAGRKKILVVYFSHSGNTREIANLIQKATGGDIFEIQPVTQYPDDYDTVTAQAKRELAAGYKPALKAKKTDIGSYDVVFIGTPVWWGTAAPPVSTFLAEHDLSGKTVAPFCTHAGGYQAHTFDDIADLCPKSTVLEGFVAVGTAAKNAGPDVEKWLREIKLINQ